MKKLLLILMLLPFLSLGQSCNSNPILGEHTYNFFGEDTAAHILYSRTVKKIPDTAPSSLWRIGTTLKPTFSNGTVAARGIMTDTASHYPANANNYFTLDLGTISNPTVTFWHRHETNTLHAGGTVEFSTDTGTTWMNVISCPYITTDSFYQVTDTLLSGLSVFAGQTLNTKRSCIDFFTCGAMKMTSTRCIDPYHPTKLLVRFRFVSDSTIDSLSGWIIDSIRVYETECLAPVNDVHRENSISISPNPVFEELNIKATTILISVAIFNTVGQAILYKEPGKKETHMDVSRLPRGLYFIRVNETETRRFLKE